MGVADLADYPWDAVAPYAERARAHPDGIVDLSIGSPVDPTPAVVARRAGRARPTRTPTRRRSARPRCARRSSDWYARRRGVPGLDPDHVLPTIGSKELVALLPLLLGSRPGDVVVHPRAAYPTYEVGAAAGRRDPARGRRPGGVAGRHAAGLAQLARATPTAGCWMPRSCAPPCARARELGAVVASRRVLRRARLGRAVGCASRSRRCSTRA